MVTHDPIAAALHRPGGLPRRRQGRRRAAQPDGRRRAREDEGAQRTRQSPAPPRRAEPHVESHAGATSLARKLRLALSAFAIVLGVAFVAGSFIFTDALERRLRRHRQGHDGRRRGARPRAPTTSTPSAGHPDDPGLGRRRARRAARASSRPTAPSGAGRLRHRRRRQAGRRQRPARAWRSTTATPRRITGDQIITLTEGELPKGPDEIALDEGTADKAGYEIGDEVTLVTPTGDRRRSRPS